MSLAPARTVAPRSSSDPAVCCALARNLSKALRACSKLASAIDRISFGISKRSRPSSLMVPLLFVFAGHHSPASRFAHVSLSMKFSPSWAHLQHNNAGARARVRTNSRSSGELRLAGLWTLHQYRAVDLPLPAGDTNVPLRLSFVWPPIS